MDQLHDFSAFTFSVIGFLPSSSTNAYVFLSTSVLHIWLTSESQRPMEIFCPSNIFRNECPHMANIGCISSFNVLEEPVKASEDFSSEKLVSEILLS